MPKDKRVAKKGKAAGARDKKVVRKTHSKRTSPLFEKRPKIFGIGGDLHPGRDLTRFVKWPKYIRLQRQRRILYARLKVPPAINQFTKTLDKNTATQLFKLLLRYKPEDKATKRKRLIAIAAAKVRAQRKKEGKDKSKAAAPATTDAAAGSAAAARAPRPLPPRQPKKPVAVKYGLNHITSLIEKKKAKLVVIAHDVDPIELVVWLPTLCKKMQVPYCIVKSKARLGAIVRKKTATALAFTKVLKEDDSKLSTLISAVKQNYNEKYDESRRQWGGGNLGLKSRNALRLKNQKVAKELNLKSGAKTPAAKAPAAAASKAAAPKASAASKASAAPKASAPAAASKSGSAQASTSTKA